MKESVSESRAEILAKSNRAAEVRGMLKVLAAIEARPGSGIAFEGSTPTGYCQTVGVTAHSQDELIRIVREFVMADTGGELLDIYEIWVPDFEGREVDIRDACGDQTAVGIWYESGHAWYSD